MVRITGEIGEPPARLLDLWRLDELRGITVDGGAISLGALTTYTEIRRSRAVPRAPAGARRGRGDDRRRPDPEPRHDRRQHRECFAGRGHAAGPARARRRVRRRRAARRADVPADEFWVAYRKTALAPDELILRVRIPVAGGREARFRKVGTRRAQAISKVVMALAWRERARSARRGVTSGLRSAPWRIGRSARRAAEAALEGRPPDPRDRRRGRRRPGRRDHPDRRRPLDGRLPAGGRRPGPAPHRPRRRRLVRAARTRLRPDPPRRRAPPGGRRSYWLREALAAEPPELAADVGRPTADGATPASTSRSSAAATRGSGPRSGSRSSTRRSGRRRRAATSAAAARRGGTAGSSPAGGTSSRPDRAVRGARRRSGRPGARRGGRRDRDVVRRRTASTRWYAQAGFLSVSAAPAQDGSWSEAADALRPARARRSVVRRCRPTRSPPGSARRCSAAARSCRRRRRPAGRACPRPAAGRAGAWRRHPRADAGRGFDGDGSSSRTSSRRRARDVSRRPGRCRAQRVGGRLAPVRPPARHVVELHRPHRADPRPPRRDRLDRRRGRRRLAVHAPLRADDARRPDRARRRRRQGRVRRPDRGGVHPRRRVSPASRRGSAALVPDAGRRPDRRRLGWPDRRRRRPPTLVRDAAGRADPLRARLLRERRCAGGPRRPHPRRACHGSPGRVVVAADRRCDVPRAFPPEPLRYLGARAVREAIVRREHAEESGRRPNRLALEISRLPRRLGYHLGPG